MKKYLFNLLFIALAVVLVRMFFAKEIEALSCLSVVIIVAMMKVR